MSNEEKEIFNEQSQLIDNSLVIVYEKLKDKYYYNSLENKYWKQKTTLKEINSEEFIYDMNSEVEKAIKKLLSQNLNSSKIVKSFYLPYYYKNNDLYINKLKFMFNNINKPIEKYREEISIIKKFMDEKLVITLKCEDKILSHEVYNMYEQWCLDKNHKTCKKTIMNKVIRELNADIYRANGIIYYTYIKLKNINDEDKENK
jgi:hypothetical protein